MKRIPIGEEEISSLNTLDVKGITLPANKYLYEDISARVFFDKAGGAFVDDTDIARFSFGFFAIWPTNIQLMCVCIFLEFHFLKTFHIFHLFYLWFKT